jgi:hypothetical protein
LLQLGGEVQNWAVLEGDTVRRHAPATLPALAGDTAGLGLADVELDRGLFGITLRCAQSHVSELRAIENLPAAIAPASLIAHARSFPVCGLEKEKALSGSHRTGLSDETFLKSQLLRE